MGAQVTNPALLAQLNASGPVAPRPVTDPALLAQLNSAATPDLQQAPSEFSLASLGRQAALMGRSVLNGISSMPLMAMDAGVATRNLAHNLRNGIVPTVADFNPFARSGGSPQAYELPSHMFDQALNDVGVPHAQSGSEKVAGFVESALTGSRIPAPEGPPTPAGFVRPVTTPKQATLEASQAAGYVVPPATTNPSVTNKILESVGGKTGIAQDARAVNEGVTNKLAAKALGLEEDTAITPELLKSIRAEAAAPNRSIRGTGTIQTDAAFQEGIDSVLSKFKSAGGVSDKLAQTEVKDIAESFNKTFPASDAVDAVQVLRDRASAAYAKGDSETGKGLRALSKVLEDQIERHLGGLGEDGADLLKRFRDGRQLMAKTFSVESALNPQTGSVSAAKLAGQLTKGKPLSGPLRTAAQFGQAFPKVAAPLMDSGSVRNTDVALGGLAAVMDQSPKWLIYPFARMGVRAGLLSSAGQKLATASGNGVPPGLLMGSQAATEDLLGQ